MSIALVEVQVLSRAPKKKSGFGQTFSLVRCINVFLFSVACTLVRGRFVTSFLFLEDGSQAKYTKGESMSRVEKRLAELKAKEELKK